jgi:hypothetical protein
MHATALIIREIAVNANDTGMAGFRFENDVFANLVTRTVAIMPSNVKTAAALASANFTHSLTCYSVIHKSGTRLGSSRSIWALRLQSGIPYPMWSWTSSCRSTAG